MRARDFIGHCNMNANPFRSCLKTRRAHGPITSLRFIGLVGLMWSTSGLAEEIPVDAVELDAESWRRIEEPAARRDWRLDPVVFTEISPVTASEIAIKLPEDQREED